MPAAGSRIALGAFWLAGSDASVAPPRVVSPEATGGKLSSRGVLFGCTKAESARSSRFRELRTRCYPSRHSHYTRLLPDAAHTCSWSCSLPVSALAASFSAAVIGRPSTPLDPSLMPMMDIGRSVARAVGVASAGAAEGTRVEAALASSVWPACP